MATLPDHSHCGFCGNPVEYGSEFCDEHCRGLRKAANERERSKDLLFYVSIAVSLISVFAVGILIRVFR